MKKLKQFFTELKEVASIINWKKVLGVIGAAVAFIAIALFFSLAVNFVVSWVIYSILAKLLGYSIEFWTLFWWMYLIVFFVNALRSGVKVGNSK